MKVAESSFGENKRVFGFREFIPFHDIPRNKDIVYYPRADHTEQELEAVEVAVLQQMARQISPMRPVSSSSSSPASAPPPLSSLRRTS